MANAVHPMIIQRRRFLMMAFRESKRECCKKFRAKMHFLEDKNPSQEIVKIKYSIQV